MKSDQKKEAATYIDRKSVFVLLDEEISKCTLRLNTTIANETERKNNGHGDDHGIQRREESYVYMLIIHIINENKCFYF